MILGTAVGLRRSSLAANPAYGIKQVEYVGRIRYELSEYRNPTIFIELADARFYLAS
jgi:hypothetical protein